MSKTQTLDRVQVQIHAITSERDYPEWLDEESLVHFLHENLKPYEDALPDIRRGIHDALSPPQGDRGFVLVAESDERLVGALVMLRTGMKGYIPENLLLFVAVNAECRGQGVGRRIIERALERADGDVKLHVEYENPARRLYERLGFTSDYAEMRYRQ
jgi:GNAT superfamily N-acetyltransferase